MTYAIEEWLRQALAPADIAALHDIPVHLGERTITLYDVLLAWAAHLGRIETELDLDVDAHHAWVEWDLLAALHFREWIRADLHKLPSAAGDRVAAAVEHIDEWYASWTEPDIDRMVQVARTVGEASLYDFSGWWWHRVPPRGPIHQALVTYHGHVHADPPP